MKRSPMTPSDSLTAQLSYLAGVAAGAREGDVSEIVTEIAYLAGREIAAGWIDVSSAEEVEARGEVTADFLAGGDTEYLDRCLFPRVIEALGGNWDGAVCVRDAEDSVAPGSEARDALKFWDIRTVIRGCTAEIASRWIR